MDIGIWIAINKNKKVSMHKECPQRNEKTGKWTSKMPFCNSIAQLQMQKLLDKSSMSWQSEPEYIELNFD